MITKIIALDPGGTTGIAMVELRDTVKVELGFDQPEPWLPQFKVEQLGPGEHHIELEDFLEKHLMGVDRKFVVIERFDYRNTSRSRVRLDSREYIGTVKGWCRRRGIPLFMQTAAQAKGFVPDQALKDANLYTKAFRHANDGMRHLIFFVVNNPEFKFKAMEYEIEFRKQLLEMGFK